MISSSNCSRKIFWLGLVCNLLILALAVVLVGWIVERRLRRQGRLFKFSLINLLLLTALVAIATGWIAQEYSLYKKNERCFSNFASDSRDSCVFVDANFKSRFPSVASQLLNHGHLPWVDPRFFMALDKQNPGVLDVSLDEGMKLGEIRELAEAAGESPFSVHLDIWDYERNVERSLIEFGDVEVTELSIEFDLDSWVDSFSDHKDPGEQVNSSMRTTKLSEEPFWTPKAKLVLLHSLLKMEIKTEMSKKFTEPSSLQSASA